MTTTGTAPVSLEKLTRQNFEARLGSHFRIELESGEGFDVTLSDVTALGQDSTRTTNEREPFSLLFHGDKDLNIGQGMVQITHQIMGKMDLFIVPIGPDHQGMRLEAVFT